MRRRESARCHVCRGSASAPGHSLTATHVNAVRAHAQRFDHANGTRLAKPTPFRDPYGRTRDWDAEAAEAQKVRAIETAAEMHTLIMTTLPEPPTIGYAADMALVTLADAAKRLGVKPGTLRMAIHRQRMIGHKMGRDWLVEESEVAWYEMRSLGKVGWPKGRPRKKQAA